MDTRWSPSFKFLVIVAVLISGTWLLFRARVVLSPLILALLLAFLASYPTNWLTRRTGWPRGLSATIVLLLALLLVAALSVLVVPWSVSLLRSFGTTLVGVIQQLLQVTPKPIEITPALTVDLGLYYAPINEWLRGLLSPDLSALENLQRLVFPFASGAAVVVIGAASGALWLIFILVVSFFVIVDAHLIYRSVVTVVPEVWRPELRKLWHELVEIWDAFMRGRLLLSLLMGFLVWAALSILGVRSAPALGFVYGILSFVPGVGPVIAAIPGILIALILGSSWIPLPNLWFALLVTTTYVLLEQFENIYFLPRIVGRRVALHPGVVIVGAVVGAELAGVLGILLAAPAIASLRVLLTYVARKLFDEEPIPTVEGLPGREIIWRDVVRERAVSGVLFDLDGTLIETDAQLAQTIAERLRLFRGVLSEQERLRLVRWWLMRSEGVVNRLISWLDRLHLDNLMLRLDDRLRRWRGIAKPDQFTAVAGSVESLRVLAQKGFSLGLVTSRSRKDTKAYLTQYDLDSLFDTIVTRDDVKWLKPHPLPVQLAAQRLGLAPSRCVLVGDTGVDVRSAKVAGSLSVGVLTGFGERNDLEGADLVLESPAHLVDWL